MHNCVELVNSKNENDYSPTILVMILAYCSSRSRLWRTIFESSSFSSSVSAFLVWKYAGRCIPRITLQVIFRAGQHASCPSARCGYNVNDHTARWSSEQAEMSNAFQRYSRFTKKSTGESPAAAAARDPKPLSVLEALTAAHSLSS